MQRSFEVGELVVLPNGRHGRVVVSFVDTTVVTVGDPDSSYEYAQREFNVIALRTENLRRPEDLHGA